MVSDQKPSQAPSNILVVLHESQANASKNAIGENEDKESGGEGGGEDGKARNHRSSHAGAPGPKPENESCFALRQSFDGIRKKLSKSS